MSLPTIGAQEPRLRIEPERAYTDGTDAGTLASAYGLTPDPWQQMILDCWLGRDEHDKFTATRAGVSVPRQTGKNAVVEMRELYGMAVNGETILHTAHEVKTARKAFLRLCSFFEDERNYPELAALVDSIRKTNGQEAIVLKNGGSVEFSARSKGAARGFTCDCVVFDEAQELTNEQMEALLSTMSAAPSGNRQMLFIGTPPYPRCPGDVFRHIRKQALSDPDDRLAWHEWSVEADSLSEIDLEDRELWYQTNPALGIRQDETFTEQEFLTLSPDGFARERLGWWNTASMNRLVTDTEWEACGTEDVPEGKQAYGVKFSVDGLLVSVCIAVKPEGSDKVHVELVMQKDTANGVGFLADYLRERRDKIALVAIDGRAFSTVLANELLKKDNGRGMSIKAVNVVSTKNVISANTMMLESIRAQTVTHYTGGGQEVLDKSILNSERRSIGKDGGWGWDGDDPTPAEAACLALWAVRTTKRTPGKKARLL